MKREDETVRLAESGNLRREEVAALREKAIGAGLRVDTPAEHISGGNMIDGVPSTDFTYSVDQRTVDLWERVGVALEADHEANGPRETPKDRSLKAGGTRN